MQVEYERTDEGRKAKVNLLMATSEKETKVKFEVETRHHKKIGRNNPCPCGSGKKYKKCCFEEVEEDGRKLD